MYRRRPPKSRYAVWAILYLSRASQDHLKTFFRSHSDIDESFIEPSLHLPVYHARRRLPDISPYRENTIIGVDPQYWRFMTMAPGGENPRPDIDTKHKKIGVRIQRKSPAYQKILNLRSRFYAAEARILSPERTPSAERRNAFGARQYQPHMTLLKAGSGIDPDLSKAGELIRATLPPLMFDQFVVRCLSADSAPVLP